MTTVPLVMAADLMVVVMVRGTGRGWRWSSPPRPPPSPMYLIINDRERMWLRKSFLRPRDTRSTGTGPVPRFDALIISFTLVGGRGRGAYEWS